MSIYDIQTVIKGGCLNLYQKAVNLGKRLKAYVQLDEGDVRGQSETWTRGGQWPPLIFFKILIYI